MLINPILPPQLWTDPSSHVAHVDPMTDDITAWTIAARDDALTREAPTPPPNEPP